MQAASIGSDRLAWVDDLQHDLERVSREAIFDGEVEGEGVDGAGPLVVVQRKPREVPFLSLDLEGLEAGEAVQAERIVAAVDARAVPRPTDDWVEDRADFVPDRRIARPQQVSPADAPAPGLRAFERDRRPRIPTRKSDRRHSTIPSISTADISASLTPGAQAMMGFPW